MTYRLLCPWDFPDKNTGLCCHFFLQGIFLTQSWSLCLLHWQVDSLPLSHQWSPLWKCLVAQSYPTFCNPHGLQLAMLLCPGGFFRQEYWSGLPCPPSGDLPNPGNKPRPPSLQANSIPLSHQWSLSHRQNLLLRNRDWWSHTTVGTWECTFDKWLKVEFGPAWKWETPEGKGPKVFPSRNLTSVSSCWRFAKEALWLWQVESVI